MEKGDLTTSSEAGGNKDIPDGIQSGLPVSTALYAKKNRRP